MDRGITLLAIGKSGMYSKWAANMAVSIKYHSPNMPINVVCDDKGLATFKPEEAALVNEFIPINPAHTVDCFGNYSPGRAKLYINEYAKFEENIYLDVDGLCIREVESLFNMMTKDVQLQCTGMWNETAKEWSCAWMTLAGVRFNYLLPDKFNLYECNSSFIYFKKGKKADEYFSQVQKNFIHNWDSKIWGSAFPDELAFNVATAQLGIDPTIEKHVEKGYKNHFPVCFNIRDVANEKTSQRLNRLQSEVYFIGLYGGNRPQFMQTYSLYDALAQKYNRELLGRHNIYKTNHMMRNKHVSTTTRDRKKDVLVREKVKEIVDKRTGLYSIDDTTKVELLACEYTDGYCFNGSIVSYNGKQILAFRKDRKPFGTNSRIFITELDNFKQVSKAKETKGLAASPGKGYEDPRLIVNDGLYLIYNDNKQQYTVKLDDDYNVLSCKKLEVTGLDNVGDGRIKNVSPFVDKDLKFIYSASGDHTIIGSKKAKSKSIDYGIIRGGSPAIKIGDKFYTVFHTTLNVEGFQHFRQYTMGVYEFDENYNITGVSKPLIIAPYMDDLNRMYNNVFVVFPVGLYVENGEVVISFGYQDKEIRVLKINEKEFTGLCKS